MEDKFYALRRKIFELLAVKRGLSVTEIANYLNLNMRTVKKAIDFLVENGFAVELSFSKLGGKQIYSFNPDAACTLIIINERSDVYAGFANLDNEISEITRVKQGCDYNLEEEFLVEQVCKLAFPFLQKGRRIIGLGVGFPGVVNGDEMYFSPPRAPYPLYRVTALAQKLREYIGLPVLMENDANAGALGEYFCRRMKDKSLVFISIGAGIGAGVIINGKLLRGEASFAGEIGYMRANFGAQIHSLVEPETLRNRWGFDPCRGTMELSDLADMIDYISDTFATCILNIITVVDVHTFILGGVTFEALGDQLLNAVRKKLPKYLPFDIIVARQKSKHPGMIGLSVKVMEAALDSLFV